MATINDLRSKRLRIEALDEAIPALEDRLERMIIERAAIEATVRKVESHELDKKHNGLCGETPENTLQYPSGVKCERFYGHTGVHSWQGGGIG